jgi:putative flippase GtrA
VNRIVAELSRLPPFARFALVGGAGFAVNEAMLWLAIHALHLGKDAAWFAAFVPSVTFTWWGNRTLTFAEHASHQWLKEWARFVATNSIGAVVNLATYEALIHFLNLDPLLALACGVLVGMVFNFTLSKRLVFRSSSPVLTGEVPSVSEAEGEIPALRAVLPRKNGGGHQRTLPHSGTATPGGASTSTRVVSVMRAMVM